MERLPFIGLIRLDYRTGASERRGKTHKRKLMPSEIKLSKKEKGFGVKNHKKNDLAWCAVRVTLLAVFLQGQKKSTPAWLVGVHTSALISCDILAVKSHI